MKNLTSLMLASLIIAPIACLASPELQTESQVAAKSVIVHRHPWLNKNKPRKNFTTMAHRLGVEYVDMSAPTLKISDPRRI